MPEPTGPYTALSHPEFPVEVVLEGSPRHVELVAAGWTPEPLAAALLKIGGWVWCEAHDMAHQEPSECDPLRHFALFRRAVEGSPTAMTGQDVAQIRTELCRRLDDLAAGDHMDEHASEMLFGIVEWLGAWDPTPPEDPSGDAFPYEPDDPDAPVGLTTADAPRSGDAVMRETVEAARKPTEAGPAEPLSAQSEIILEWLQRHRERIGSAAAQELSADLARASACGREPALPARRSLEELLDEVGHRFGGCERWPGRWRFWIDGCSIAFDGGSFCETLRGALEAALGVEG